MGKEEGLANTLFLDLPGLLKHLNKNNKKKNPECWTIYRMIVYTRNEIEGKNKIWPKPSLRKIWIEDRSWSKVWKEQNKISQDLKKK